MATYNADTNDGASSVDEAKRPDAQSDADILAEAKKRRAQCVAADADNRTNALDDLRFLIGGENQWDPAAVQDRRNAGRPVITVNTLPTYLHQVTNDQRQNTPSIKVAAVDDKADLETAKVFQGLIRHIEYDSNADVAYDRAVNSGAAIGWGYFRLVTEYEAEDSFDQCIKFRSIRNHLSVRLDPFSIEPDGSDAKFCFVETVLSRDESKRTYPDATVNDASLSQDSSYAGWITDDSVLITEYYRIEQVPATLCEYADGTRAFKEEGAAPLGVPVVRERATTRSKLMWFKLTATDILDRVEIKCKWIPVFPVYGDEVDLEGNVIRSGIIRHAKGPAQSYNVFMTSATEEVGARVKTPYIGAEGQFEGHEDEWENANNLAYAFLEYKPTSYDGKLLPPPQRQPMADVPAGMLAMAMHASDNVKKTTGLFDASLGARGTATSGKQELAQQREGDMANFHYADGLNRTVRHVGRCLVNMIPNYYDGERTIRILGEDNAAEYVTINQANVSGKRRKDGSIPAVLNDLSAGRYDITVKAGPSYSTMRQESSEFFTNAMQAAKDPATLSVVTYLAIKNQDVPGADVATKMLEALLPPPAKAVIDEENGTNEDAPQMVQTPEGPIPADQAGQVIAQLQQATMQMKEALDRGEAAKAQAEAMKQQALMNDQQLEPGRQAVEAKKLEAEIAKAQATHAQAQAALAQAEVDMVRAQAEAQCAPLKVEAETHAARATALKAENELRQPIVMPKSPEEEAAAEASKDAKMLQQLAAELAKTKPKAAELTIKAPSGQVYDVKAALH